MKKIMLAAFVIFISTASYSQNDSTKIFSNSSGESRSEMIAKSRRVLLDAFIEKNFFKVMNEMEYLMTQDDENYIALYPQEYWLLSYWIKDYNAILMTINAPDSGMLNSKVKRIPPQNDYLTTKVIEKTRENEGSLTEDINKSLMNEEEKDFLLINLKFLSENIGFVHPRQNELNVTADNFLNKYPGGKYAGFVRRFIRVKYEPTSSGVGYSISGGAILFSGNAKNYFNSPTFVGFGVDALKNKWIFQVNIGFAIGKTKADMPVNGFQWPSGSKTFGGHIDLAAGYFVLDNQRIGIAPYASIGIFGLPSNANMDKQPELKEAGIKTNIAGTFGFMTDIKLRTKSQQSNYQHITPGTQTTSLRLTYGYITTPQRNKYADLSGSIHKITLGIAVMTKKNRRVQ